MPRAAVLTASRTKSTSSTTRRPVLKVVPVRRAPAAAPKTHTSKKAVLAAVPAAATTPTPVTYNKNDLLKRFAPLVRQDRKSVV